MTGHFRTSSRPRRAISARRSARRGHACRGICMSSEWCVRHPEVPARSAGLEGCCSGARAVALRGALRAHLRVTDHTPSLETEKLAELRELRARRAKAVGRMAVVAVADGDRAEQHLLGRHFDEFADDAMHAGPGFLRAGIEAVAAGKERQSVDIAAEIGPLAGAEVAVDGDEQRGRRIEELEI